MKSPEFVSILALFSISLKRITAEAKLGMATIIKKSVGDVKKLLSVQRTPFIKSSDEI